MGLPNDHSRDLVWSFTLGSLLLFGFIAWKPYIWTSITPFRGSNEQKLAAIYRWISIATICGVLIHFLVFK